MHALMIPSWYPAGPDDLAGSFFRDQAHALVDAGHRIGVLAPRLVSLPDVGRAHPQRGVRWSHEDGLVVARLDLLQWVPRARTLEAALAGAPTGAARRAFEAYVARFGRPDVLHAHSLYPGGYLAAALSRRSGIPWVLTEHRSLDHLRVLTSAGARREAGVVAGARVRCGVSRGHAEHLAHRFGPRGGRWEVAHDLVTDPGPVPRPNRAVGRPVVGHLSNLAPVKRLDRVVAAFARARREVPTARLLIAGPLGGAAGGELRRLVAASGCADAIETLGALERERVPAFLSGLDVLLMPSDSETFGVAAAESLAQGTPVVATRTWGGVDVIGPGDGILVGSGEGRGEDEVVAGLARALVDVWRTGDEDATGSREARRVRCRQRFGVDAFVARTERIWAEARR